MRSSQIVPLDLAVDGAAYTSGDVVGTLMSFAVRDQFAELVLKDVVVVDPDNQKAPLTVLFFKSQPAGTFTNNGALTLSAADALLCIGKVNVVASDYETLATRAIAELETSRQVRSDDNYLRKIYVLVVTTGTPTYAGLALRLILKLLPTS